LIGGVLAAFGYEFGIRRILMARRAPEPGVHGVGETATDRPTASELD
jgi:hypothetical protein